MNYDFEIERFLKLPLVGILRGFKSHALPGIVGTCRRAGLTHLEITMNTRGADRQIADAVALGGGELTIGAGTVTTPELLARALAAGAAFIVTPCVQPEILRRCADQEVPIFPGAFSPTEVWTAWKLGATFVKLFPADVLGADFVRALKGPFPQVRLMPTGGIGPDTLSQFIEAGADAFGIGGPLFDRSLIEAGDWAGLAGRCRAFIESYRISRASLSGRGGNFLCGSV